MNIVLSPQLVEVIGKAITEHKEEMYWGYPTPLGQHNLKKIREEGLFAWADHLYELNLDSVAESELKGKQEVIKNHLHLINDELKPYVVTVEDICDAKIFDDYYIDYSFNVGELLNREYISASLSLHSNYDCINSHHFEGSYSMEETYFGDMVNFLKLNPAKVKAIFIENGIEVFGTWRNIPSRNGKELVSYDDFVREIENSCCGANLLTFAVRISLSDLWDSGKDIEDLNNGVITLPKGTKLGLFSSFQGGGSVMDMELLRDTNFKMGQIGKTQYDSLDFCFNGYTIEDVYGVNSSFNSEISIEAV